ncbi:serine threonine kinase [Fusarium coicis]|nr:serine threonine kinase [Fusarium coicis]
MGKVTAIADVCDEGLSDEDLPFDLDPNGLRLVRRNGTSSQPIQAFINWREHESDMFDSYQWCMLAPYFVLPDDDPRVMHYTMSHMIPLPFSMTENVPNSAMSPGNSKFWASNPPGVDVVDMATWISAQLFGLADALQLIRDLFHSGVLAEKQPPHRDLSPERILCFETKGITQCVLKIADFGSMQYHDDQAHHQRGSDICIDSAYRAPELLTGEPAPNSDLWSFGCIILHFIVWSHGGWALVNSLSVSTSAEEEEGSDDDKFFKFQLEEALAVQ